MLKLFDVEPAALEAKGVATNWYEQVHSQLMPLIPAAFKRAYMSRDDPTEDEWRALTANHSGDDRRGKMQQAAAAESSARCGHPTTWTILQHDGPDHLGLCGTMRSLGIKWP